jgi:phosphoserine phosphatase RsbX
MTRVTAGTFVRAIAGESVSGDACIVEACACGVVVAAVDGLGHGPAAALAPNAFVECVRAGLDASLVELFATANRALRKTRGAVGVVARFDEAAGSVEIAGLGNVTALLSNGSFRPKHIVLPAGVVGGTLRSIRPQVLDFFPGDVLLLHTDGVQSGFDWARLRCLSPEDVARAIVTNHGRETDDAGCLVVVGTTSMAPRPWRPDPAGV